MLTDKEVARPEADGAQPVEVRSTVTPSFFPSASPIPSATTLWQPVGPVSGSGLRAAGQKSPKITWELSAGNDSNFVK